MLAQRTLKSITRAVGVGMHSGQKVELTLRPAPPDHGIVFRRVDLPVPVELPVRPETVTDTRMATTLTPPVRPGGPKVQTIEHLMSACAGLGIDNLTVEVDGPEVPILDGSSAQFVQVLMNAGLKAQPALQRVIRILEPIEVRMGAKSAALLPANPRPARVRCTPRCRAASSTVIA